MNSDLFLAILAMDSYNRGYDQRIISPNLSDSSGIGNATITFLSDIEAGSAGVEAGFYAVAYELNGETIVSYRGTDALFANGRLITGGTTIGWWGGNQEKGIARDFLNPWITYGLTEDGDLLVDASIGGDLDPSQSAEEILQFAQVVDNWSHDDLGIRFVTLNNDDTVSNLKGLFAVVAAAAAYIRQAKAYLWELIDDPLVLDLNGDGLVSFGVNSSGGTFFDNDGDYFAEATGWISGDDGFLVHDADGNGLIEDISELFGSPGVSGFAELDGWDTTGDGIVNALDTNFGELQIWQDRNSDGLTQEGELFSLADLNITALSARGVDVDIETASGTVIRSESFFTRSDGSTGGLGELIFETDRTQGRYRGDRGKAAYALEENGGADAKGYGRLTDLAVAASQDNRVADEIAALGQTMNAGDLDLLRRQVQPLLSAWSQGNYETRELSALLLSADGTERLDYAIYDEDTSEMDGRNNQVKQFKGASNDNGDISVSVAA